MTTERRVLLTRRNNLGGPGRHPDRRRWDRRGAPAEGDTSFDLLCCPFCGSGDVAVSRWASGCQIVCRHCRALGPEAVDDKLVADSRWRAIAAWNERVGRISERKARHVS